jgi:hypothetical protein
MGGVIGGRSPIVVAASRAVTPKRRVPPRREPEIVRTPGCYSHISLALNPETFVLLNLHTLKRVS